uniref:DUF7515 domain-containing protein n=1 Tax=Ditylenchus dipsaci TaxID=166011 RepID=A0A915EFM9_9BILA
MSEISEETQIKKLESFRSKLAATVGSIEGSQGCTLSEMEKRFKEDWNEKVSTYIEMFRAGTIKQLLNLDEVKKSVELLDNNGQVWVRPVVTSENSHIYALIDRSQDKKKDKQEISKYRSRPPPKSSKYLSLGGFGGRPNFYQSMGPHPHSRPKQLLRTPVENPFARPVGRQNLSIRSPEISKSKASKRIDSNGFMRGFTKPVPLKSLPYNPMPNNPFTFNLATSKPLPSQPFIQSEPVRMPDVVQKISKRMSKVQINDAQDCHPQSLDQAVPTPQQLLKEGIEVKPRPLEQPIRAQSSFSRSNIEKKPQPGPVVSSSGFIFLPPSFDSKTETLTAAKPASFSSSACVPQCKPVNDGSTATAVPKKAGFSFSAFKSSFKPKSDVSVLDSQASSCKSFAAPSPFKPMFSSAEALAGRSSQKDVNLSAVQLEDVLKAVEPVSKPCDPCIQAQPSDVKSQCSGSEISSSRTGSKFSTSNNLLMQRQLNNINKIAQTNASGVNFSRFLSSGWTPIDSTLKKSVNTEQLVETEPFTSKWKEGVIQNKPSIQKVHQCIKTVLSSQQLHPEFFDKDYFLAAVDETYYDENGLLKEGPEENHEG